MAKTTKSSRAPEVARVASHVRERERTRAEAQYGSEVALRKWERNGEGWIWRTESLGIFIHGHIDSPNQIFVSTMPTIGMDRTPCNSKEHGFELVRDHLRKLWEELVVR